MGGLQEYFASSYLFIYSGVFLICLDCSTIEKHRNLEEFYHRSVGIYLHPICLMTAKAITRPKIVLVATKKEFLPNKFDTFGKVLELAKKHISSIFSDDHKVFLVDEVLETSSAEVTEDYIARRN